MFGLAGTVLKFQELWENFNFGNYRKNNWKYIKNFSILEICKNGEYKHTKKIKFRNEESKHTKILNSKIWRARTQNTTIIYILL